MQTTTRGQCAQHGQYTSLAGFSCPTCRRIAAARSIVEHGRGRGPAHRRALAYLAENGERGRGHPAGAAISFDLGGAA